jgi:hypothetical protein
MPFRMALHTVFSHQQILQPWGVVYGPKLYILKSGPSGIRERYLLEYNVCINYQSHETYMDFARGDGCNYRTYMDRLLPTWLNTYHHLTLPFPRPSYKLTCIAVVIGHDKRKEGSKGRA